LRLSGLYFIDAGLIRFDSPAAENQGDENLTQPNRENLRARASDTIVAPTFEQAADTVLRYLREHSRLGLWSVSRFQDDDWILLRVDDRAYDVTDNTVLQWQDSFCSRMVRGEGPMFDHDCKLSGAYCDAPIGQQLEIGAYIGIPLQLPDGTIFGTLCGIDPAAQPPFDEAFKASVQLAAELLSLILAQEIRELRTSHQLKQAIAESHRDPLTGVANRRGWESRVDEEEQRLQPLAEPACVIVIDLDDLKKINDTLGHLAGDTHLHATATALQGCLRGSDFVARIGGDEFAVLTVSCNREQALQLLERIRNAFAQRRIGASLGMAMRRQNRPLHEAFQLADQRMYEDKRQRPDLLSRNKRSSA